MNLKWIFIDSLTEIASRCVEDYQKRYPDKKDSFNLWGGYLETMTRLIKFFRDMTSYNVIFTCLESVDLDEVKRRFIARISPGDNSRKGSPAILTRSFI